jgi:hypothetical protein
MESELWYLVLIPVLFAAGWWARGLDAGERERNSRRLPEAYSRGVAMLMSDRPDKAIDPFIEVVRLDPELIELHHVLGTSAAAASSSARSSSTTTLSTARISPRRTASRRSRLLARTT